MEFPDAPETRRKRIRHAIQCAEAHEDAIASEFAEEKESEYGSVMAEDVAEGYAYERQKALREGVRGKGLN